MEEKQSSTDNFENFVNFQLFHLKYERILLLKVDFNIGMVKMMDWMSPTSLSGIITFVALFSWGVFLNVKLYNDIGQ
ncbi:hypothetical protein AM500_23440 [Bacillus sp. FJAT-18017]|nr:hypothetical protein AM500_23440 [Bacillus sp. FJAT-18017]